MRGSKKYWLKELAGDIFLSAASLFILINLILIAIYKRIVIWENYIFIIVFEIIFTTLLVILGVERAKDDIKAIESGKER